LTHHEDPDVNNNTNEQEVTCKGCIHFYITHDPAFPYGCRAMKFKGKDFPYLVVRAASEVACQMRKTKDVKV